MAKKDKEEKKCCKCEEDFESEENCACDEECECGEECECKENQECNCQHESAEEHDGECTEVHCEEISDKATEYLQMAQRLQADFQNYRKHVAEDLERAREDGAESVIEAFLPSLDTFKEAKKNIADETVLQGINMIENKILDALAKLKVEKIETVGQKFDPHRHNVIAVSTDESQEDGVILEEFQSGWMKGDKVIRYSTVLVNKLN